LAEIRGLVVEYPARSRDSRNWMAGLVQAEQVAVLAAVAV